MPTPKAIRLYFKRTEDGLELVRSRRLNMRAPAVLDRETVEQTKQTEAQTGFWLDVSDEKGELLYRRRIAEAGRERLEAYTGDKEQPFAVSEKLSDEIVTVVVPEYPHAASLKIRQQFVERRQANERTPARPGEPLKSREVLELDLRRLNEQGGEK
jgi:hypothetical protein